MPGVITAMKEFAKVVQRERPDVPADFFEVVGSSGGRRTRAGTVARVACIQRQSALSLAGPPRKTGFDQKRTRAPKRIGYDQRELSSLMSRRPSSTSQSTSDSLPMY